MTPPPRSPVAVIARDRRGGGACGDGGGRGGNARGPGAARLVLDGRRRRGDKYGPGRAGVAPVWRVPFGLPGVAGGSRGPIGGLRAGLDGGMSRRGSEGPWRDPRPSGGLRAGSGSGRRGGEERRRGRLRRGTSAAGGAGAGGTEAPWGYRSTAGPG